MTALDIIYVNYNSTDCLIRSLYSLFKTSHEYFFNIFVVDNASHDNVNRLKFLFPKIHLIQNTKNLGFGAAVNQALALCHSKYIVILNPDTYTSERFFDATLCLMDQSERIGVVGPRILDEDGSVQGSARAFPTALTSLFGRNSPITKIFPTNSITRKNILTIGCDQSCPLNVDWVSGACMMVRREAIEKVGGFDERFFLYWEDTDLCRRIREAGYDIMYLPAAKAIHLCGRSSHGRPIFCNYHFHKSCYLLYAKYAKRPFSFLTPIAAIVLMLRFLVAVAFNRLNGVICRIQQIRQKRQARRGKRSVAVRSV